MMILLSMTTVSDWITLITLIAGLIGAIAALIPTAIRLYESLKEIAKNKDWAAIIKMADIAIQAAEKTGEEGAKKKEIAIKAVLDECETLGIEVSNLQLEELSRYIEETILFINTMTKNKKIGAKAQKEANK